MDACRGAEAIIIATEWKEFRDIDWEEVYATMNKPAFVFDGRLILDVPRLEKIGFKVSTDFRFHVTLHLSPLPVGHLHREGQGICILTGLVSYRLLFLSVILHRL